ncbi:hypothetical protein [Micromonospora phaseoli]|uniref:hypothetical protein n=1 Tax=Micromonospora phaseoli TaxID=1144548 RepID=UPI001E3C1F57|nr:hypothetical protein [Micromonospora phaseoli]
MQVVAEHGVGSGGGEQRRDRVVPVAEALTDDRLVGAGSLGAPPPGTAASRADLAAAVRDLLRALTG